jgi:hypothetical protein
MSNFLKKVKEKLLRGAGIPAVLALVALLALAAGCNNGTTGGGGLVLIPVTGISGVPKVAVKDRPLTLNGIVEPANASNRIIVWSGTGVNSSTGVLTAPTAETTGTPYTVTATIVNGIANLIPYTRNFTITAYDAGSGVYPNPFGTDGTNGIWIMDTKENGTPQYDTVLVTLTENTWTATENGGPYNNGTYTWIEGTYAAEWAVTGGVYGNYTGIAIIGADGRAAVSNFAGNHSGMNGNLVKLASPASLAGTWKTSVPVLVLGGYLQLVIENNGNWILTVSPNGSSSWKQRVQGISVQTTNPAAVTITHLRTYP